MSPESAQLPRFFCEKKKKEGALLGFSFFFCSDPGDANS